LLIIVEETVANQVLTLLLLMLLKLSISNQSRLHFLTITVRAAMFYNLTTQCFKKKPFFLS